MKMFPALVALLGVGIPTLWFIYRLLTKQKLRQLNGKVVLITGASSGLGEALAYEFYLAGSKVILGARRTNELQRVKQELLDLKCETKYELYKPCILTLDLSDIASIPDKVLEASNYFGVIDILVNNAGISYRGDALYTSTDVDMQLMTTNYLGTAALTKVVLPHMMRHGKGEIVVVSSVQGKIAIPHRSAYAASKHATEAFFECLRAEVSHHNIHITMVSPEYIRTNLSLNALTASGAQYGQMDKTTAGGMAPRTAAQRILEAVAWQRDDVIIAGFKPKAAIYLNFLLPSFYRYIMKKRALAAPSSSSLETQ
ncbi:PREDICTED: dehydrogenase/reductase SDR family protein 7-like [Priapulus caudatus]|uniref:Dehydrogenase/reductase SDR family protein 7-like n=1 Tax=Priapulus caudatus TaxID=37621 RepID=A0ABM1DNK9_PRICU|nr:PREDICTED: dehydrogenase/reductase SDR family protein 7-like [Priapulus caudatus]XP_014661531.1 PREDICTED: dehydrogenase/reductase SDR family protein 7-like [Priapulus caudatus]XP_014661533.1 PREDICTED: dehydrogenase/reductase SDR family protein 7-like [Priapulus caudatus]XP_014661534.1 PREDICTED: dehydrogenase/reductase SDR family protein 7-like [Priapulus caudatus]